MIRPALLALVALATPAAATPPAGQGLEPGFWIFPAETARDADHLRELCAHGFTLVQTDGSWLSVFAPSDNEMDRLIVDGEARCLTEGDRQYCNVILHETGGTASSHFHNTTYSRDPAGALIARLTVDGSRQTVSYPQMCPAEAVRDLLVDWLRP
jgi:hypothetical protein